MTRAPNDATVLGESQKEQGLCRGARWYNAPQRTRPRGARLMSAPLLESQSPALPVPPPVTPEDLLAMPDGHRYELINGKLVERNMGTEADEIALNIMALVRQFVRTQRLGKSFGSASGYQCFSDD